MFLSQVSHNRINLIAHLYKEIYYYYECLNFVAACNFLWFIYKKWSWGHSMITVSSRVDIDAKYKSSPYTKEQKRHTES